MKGITKEEEQGYWLSVKSTPLKLWIWREEITKVYMGTAANTKQSSRLKLSWEQESARAPEKYLKGTERKET